MINQLKKVVIVGITSIFLAGSVSMPVSAKVTGGKAYADPKNGECDFYSLETTYAGSLPYQNRYHEATIKRKYGEEASALWIQGLKDGDLVPFREKIGDFTHGNDFFLHDDRGGFGGVTLSPAEDMQDSTDVLLGPYATVQDYIACAQSMGYDPFNVDSRCELCIAVVLGKVTKPDKITKAQYQKNHPATEKNVAPSAAVEALKIYRGNTSEFNAYQYYTRYPDLQVAYGANGDALIKHYCEHGKAEGRNAK